MYKWNRGDPVPPLLTHRPTSNIRSDCNRLGPPPCLVIKTSRRTSIYRIFATNVLALVTLNVYDKEVLTRVLPSYHPSNTSPDLLIVHSTVIEVPYAKVPPPVTLPLPALVESNCTATAKYCLVVRPYK